MRAKFTPGPWSYHSWGIASGKRFGIETADRRHGLASISPNETASTLLTMEQHEANARLIAAAPELLRILHSARVHVERAASEWDRDALSVLKEIDAICGPLYGEKWS